MAHRHELEQLRDDLLQQLACLEASPTKSTKNYAPANNPRIEMINRLKLCGAWACPVLHSLIPHTSDQDLAEIVVRVEAGKTPCCKFYR